VRAPLDLDVRTYREVVTAAHEEVAKATIERALVETAGNITRAADSLELSRSHLNRLIKQYELVERARQLRLAGGQGARVTDGDRRGQVLGARRKR